MTVWLVTVALIPALWSGLLTGARYLTRAMDVPRDAEEKTFLALLLAPIGAGGVLATTARFINVHVPIPVRPFMGGIDGPSTVEVGSTVVKAHFDIVPYLPALVLAAYIIIAVVLLLRLVIATIGMARIAVRARIRSDLGMDVFLSCEPVPPLAWGLGRIILPLSLTADLAPAQLALVVRHEREHLRRRDPLYFWLLSLIEALFWFNPFVRMQTMRCRLAAELACDAGVTSAVPEMRKIYAETLVMVLKHAAGGVRQYAPAAFSLMKSGDNQMRISRIMQPTRDGCKSPRLWLYGLAILLAVPVALTQMAWSQSPVAHKAATLLMVPALASNAAAVPSSSEFPVTPMEGAVSSGFGMRLNPLTHKKAFHDGVDITTATGTPVRAPADGKVITSSTWRNYGKILEIDHGKGRVTRYIHLDSIDVAVGDQVTAGQVVAKSGNTGLSTGPHLHVSLYLNGKAIDPTGPLHLQKAVG